MWDGLLLLLSYSLVMGIASFLAGLLPLSFGLSQNHSRVISALGTGLLVGTCLIIIIPEGIETLYSAGGDEGPANAPRQESGTPDTEPLRDHREPHAFIGLSLITGFVLMYLIDQIPKHAASATKSANKPLHISLANLSQGPHRAASPNRTEDGLESFEDPMDSQAVPQSSATTIGLVIHAAADGIALAASSFISRSSVGFIVFLALMIHKSPAAFGLTSVLLKQEFTKRQARAHLVVFSLAAPVGAIATWVLVNLIAGGRLEGGEGTKFWTGLLLLFSGGTFLYVAMHTMQENGDASSHEHSTGNGYLGGSAYSSTAHVGRREQPKQPRLRDTMLNVVGMLLPLVAQLGHAH